MTQKEQAEELINKYTILLYKSSGNFSIGMNVQKLAVQCAITAVEEILRAGKHESVNQYFNDRHWLEVHIILSDLSRNT